ncbi:MAG: ROK family glucokinase [Lachnospiraceae bacterium]|nr:ROK family glucokinase [Lachnospiraceae bacterium]
MKKYGFGVDIGGTTCKLGLFETTGELKEKWEIKTNTANHGASILDDVAKAVEAKIQELGISKEEIAGIGVGVPGPVDSAGVVHRCVNLGWDQFNVQDALSEKCGMMVRAANDANVAALGEMWQGGGKGHRNVVMITLGTGVGGGIIVDGKVVAGFHGAGGEIGHIMMDEHETDTCGCGKKGCLEQYASATGIVRMTKKLLAIDERDSTLRNKDSVTAKDIFDAAKEGDALALEAVEVLGRMLGTAMANIACVSDPEIFVIGGGVSRAGKILTDAISRYYTERSFHACRDTKIALASLGNDAGMYGCVQMLLD